MGLTHEERDKVAQQLLDDSKLMHHKIDQTLTLSTSNNRALQGHNRTPGLVADMAIVKPMVESMNIVLNGDPKDKNDTGMVGEQKVLRDAEEKRSDNAKWLVRLVIGFVVLEVLAGIALWISS